MASRTDTLKIATADVETIGRHVANARRPRSIVNYPEDEARSAVRLLERTARRIRKAFRMDEEED